MQRLLSQVRIPMTHPDIIDAETGKSRPSPRRKMRSLNAEEVRRILDLIQEHDRPLYQKITRGEFLRLKVLVERRAR